MTRVTIAVDLAKSVFQLVVSEESGRISERKRLTRPQFLRFWENRAPGRVLMEACGSAHFHPTDIARSRQAPGFLNAGLQVRLRDLQTLIC
jgi:transposase